MSSNETPRAPALDSLEFTVFGFIARPPSEVYEAVADPEMLSRYFTTGGAQGRIETGATVEPEGTRVEFEFREVDGGARTEVRITERAWRNSAAGAQGAFGNCMGWTGMLAAMKAWLEHGIRLREGFYR